MRKWWDTAIVSPSSSKFNPLKIERKWGEKQKGRWNYLFTPSPPPTPTIFFTLIFFFFFHLSHSFDFILFTLTLVFFFFPNKRYIYIYIYIKLFTRDISVNLCNLHFFIVSFFFLISTK